MNTVHEPSPPVTLKYHRSKNQSKKPSQMHKHPASPAGTPRCALACPGARTAAVSWPCPQPCRGKGPAVSQQQCRSSRAHLLAPQRPCANACSPSTPARSAYRACCSAPARSSPPCACARAAQRPSAPPASRALHAQLVRSPSAHLRTARLACAPSRAPSTFPLALWAVAHFRVCTKFFFSLLLFSFISSSWKNH